MKLDKIIERYNKGQDIYFIEIKKQEIFICLHENEGFKIPIAPYEFLINPKYRYLDHFHKCKEWQDEFIIWMNSESVNIVYDNIMNAFLACNVYLSKTSLIGYILQFLMED